MRSTLISTGRWKVIVIILLATRTCGSRSSERTKTSRVNPFSATALTSPFTASAAAAGDVANASAIRHGTAGDKLRSAAFCTARHILSNATRLHTMFTREHRPCAGLRRQLGLRRRLGGGV